ncbi:MAG: hypothetical protein AB8B53_13750 [Flavobacteriales bacterium]
MTKLLITTVLFSYGFLAFSQGNVTYEYDAAGNRVLREYTVLSQLEDDTEIEETA